MQKGAFMKNQNFVRNLVGTAILAALVLALQLLLGSLKLGPFNITLTLVPIILGAVLYSVFWFVFPWFPEMTPGASCSFLKNP